MALDNHLVSDQERVNGDMELPDSVAPLSEAMRVPPPQYHPAASPELHLQAMRVEIQHLLRTHARKSPVALMQRFMRGRKDRRWVTRRRKHGPGAATRIQARVRARQWRQRMLDSIDEFLRDEAPEVLLGSCGWLVGCGTTPLLTLFLRYS